PEIYMHCSYAMTGKKHAIKKELMRQMRRACLEGGCKEIPGEKALFPPPAERPTIVVVAEHVLEGHAVHRTHSLSIASLRERFHVVGVIFPPPQGTPIEQFFDECVEVPALDYIPLLAYLADEISKRKPALIFYLGVGMV